MNLLSQPLLIGAWIGLIHAFDADHISTLSSLALRERTRSPLGYAARWACGHALAICALGLVATGVGLIWLPGVSQVAEILVSALLIALGINTLVSIGRLRAHPSATGVAASSGGEHREGAGLVMGILHGGAGSAAVLALAPVAGFESPLPAIGFLLTFSLGVAAGALVFAAIFSGLVLRTVATRRRVATVVAAAVGLVAVFVGASMLAGLFDVG